MALSLEMAKPVPFLDSIYRRPQSTYSHYPICTEIRNDKKSLPLVLRPHYTPTMKLAVRHLLPLVAGVVLATIATSTVVGQDWAKARLEASPRHREYVSLKHGSRTLQAFVVYPEVKEKAPVVILIHEIFGLSDWAKEMADELAAQGFIVIAPDLLTRLRPQRRRLQRIPEPGRNHQSRLRPRSRPWSRPIWMPLPTTASICPPPTASSLSSGFCWGGGKSFAFATHRNDLSAAFVFYGPRPADVSAITAPVYGFYAGNDARIGATVPRPPQR